MNATRLLPPLVLAALCTSPGPRAAADVPSPSASEVDPCLRVCPSGDMNFHVAVRNAIGNPFPFAQVVVDLCSNPGVILCPLSGSEPYRISGGCFVVQTANASGIADIPLRAGGVCFACPVKVYADGVLLRTLTAVSSPDQNGDAAVDAADQGILAAKMGGPYDPTGDFNCSAALDPVDPAILAGHLGHSCGAVVPVLPGSWGRIKLRYR